MAEGPALLLVGHGSRSAQGVSAYWQFADVVRAEAPELRLGCGFIELAQPDLDTAIAQMVESGATSVVAVPLVLLGAGHMKNDGPATLARARRRHGGVEFAYARDLGIHPAPLKVAAERIAATTAGWPAEGTAVVVVSRGSSDPDANADLFKVSRLLWDSHAAQGVEAAFVSLAPPSVADALERCRRLGASRIAVVPYFLFPGVLVERIGTHAELWAAAHPEIDVRTAPELGPDPRLAQLVLERYREARQGDVRMNCDCCAYRVALPGYEDRVGAPLVVGHHRHDR
ncbi:MAG: sirohydrochlorin chelatase [Actinomycetota bacterium]|nr:sirohydrochlorin chelatase [Actinomycetota bacterium]